MPCVLVTGPTGNMGRELVRVLVERGVPTRLAVRDPASTPPGTEAVAFDFADPTTFAPALAGVDALFLLRPPAIADVASTLIPFVQAAEAAGVGRVVFLSVTGADVNRFIPHHKVEAHLLAGRLPWVILRPGFFAQNFADAYRDDIRTDRRIYVPSGAGRVAFVDLRDVAEVAANALLGAYTQRGLTLTGPAAFSFDDAARWLTSGLGHAIRYEPAWVFGYAAHLRKKNLPWPQVAVLTALHVGLRFGQAEAVEPTLADLLGRPARGLDTYLADHLKLWG